MGDDPQAFPGAYCVGPNDDLYPSTPGMSLRDWFAGQALAGGMVGAFSAGFLSVENAANLAKESFLIADAMLAARAVAPPVVAGGMDRG